MTGYGPNRAVYLGDVERYRQFEYLDQLTITIAYGALPDAADQVFTISTHPVLAPGERWDEASYIDLLLPILAQEDSPHPPSHFLTVRKSQTAWGASAAGADILLYICNNATTGVIGALAWKGITEAFQEISKRSTFTNGEKPMTLEQAVARAKLRVVTAYTDVSSETLTVIRQEELTQENSWVIRLRSPKATFEVELGVVKGIPSTTRIKRSTETDT
jgi:hypothetical protein